MKETQILPSKGLWSMREGNNEYKETHHGGTV